MKKISSRLKDLREKFQRLGGHPVFDWYCSLAVFCVLVSGVLILSALVYVRLGSADIPIPVTESAGEERAGFKIDSLEKTLGGLKERRESARSVPESVLVDPSL